MIESMTGFGRADVHKNGFSVEAEIRTVNNRYCDVFIKMPAELQQFENEIRLLLQNRFERGKINLTIKLEKTDENGSSLRVNKKLAQAYTEMLSNLCTELGLSGKPTLDHLIQFSDIFKSDALTEEQEKIVQEALMEAVHIAIEKTIEMRKNEGEELAKDSLDRIESIRGVIEEIKVLAGERIVESRTRMQDRIQSVLTEDQYDKDRLELEIALLADKLDITEELVRLEAHLKFFTESVKSSVSAGRKLNFLMQEMLREVNTIGSKAYHSGISHKVVDVKETIEIIREQIQNVV